MWVCMTWMMAGKGIAMMGMEPRGSRVRGSRRGGLLRRSASASAVHTRTKTNAGLVAVVAVGLLILAGCGGTTGSGTSPTASPEQSHTAAPGSCATGGGGAGTCVIGNFGPGGGIVFYVNEAKSDGSRYMEAAPNTWSGGSSDPEIAWCSNTREKIPGSFGTVIGTGRANTTDMVAGGACSSGAANSVRAYTVGEQVVGDWSLPSKDELNELYLRRATVGGFPVGGLNVRYWSSSQNSANSAWCQNFNSGGQYRLKKFYSYHVRPVRAF